jgi:hypothetical protein
MNKNLIDQINYRDLSQVGRSNGSSPKNKLDASNRMPVVSDKFLLRLEYLVGDGFGLSEEDPQFAQCVAEELRFLVCCLEREGQTFCCPQINALIKNIEDTKLISKNFFLEFKDEILQQLRPFDIDEVIYLIGETETATRNISGKDVIMLVGKTGCGKSSTTHYLGGSKMKYENAVEKENVIVDVPKDEQLQNIKIGGTAQSTTRFITSIKVTTGGIFTKKEIWICDSAGLDDTSGAEVDVANSIGFIQALKACKTIRFLVLFSMKGGNKLEEVVDVTRSIARMVPHNEIQNCVPSFCYG